MQNLLLESDLRQARPQPPIPRLRRAWRRGDTAGRVASWCGNALVAAVAVVMAAPITAAAQEAPPAAAAPATATRLEAPLADRSHAQRLYRQVEAWVHAGSPASVPASAPAEDATSPASILDHGPIPVSGLAGVRVTLRLPGGLTVGAGEAGLSELEPNAAGTVDLSSAGQLAVGRALQDVRKTLQDFQVRAALDKQPVDNTEWSYDQVVRRLLVDLQVAHRLAPIHVAGTADDDAIFYQFAPGFHGLRMQRADATGQVRESAVWPATAVASNLSPKSQLVQVMSPLGYQARDIERLGRLDEEDGLPIERFEVIHLVRPAPQAPVAVLTRGQELLPTRSLDGPTLDAMADLLGEHLMRRIDDHGRQGGTYLPTSDQFESVENETQEAALTAYALGLWANYLSERDAADRRAFHAHAKVRQVIDRLSARIDARVDPLDPPTMALMVMTIVESPHMPDRKVLRDRMAERLMALRDEGGLFVSGSGRDAAPMGLTEQALVIDALAHLYAHTRNEALGAKLRASQAALWSKLGREPPTSALPWLLDADVRLGRLGERAPAAELPPARGEGGEAAGASDTDYAGRYLLAMRALRERQVAASPEGEAAGPDDAVGGFDFHRTPAGSPPNPDWRSALALAFLAEATRQPEIVPPQERLGWVLTSGLAARFLAQLMFAEPGMFYVRGREESVGGVRLSLWDNRLTATSSAMALLAVLEFQETLEAIAEEGGLAPRAAR